MAKTRILFVDDDPNILDGLRRMMHARRMGWDMYFRLGGAEALALLDEQAVDVIVSDMRMPVMDGAELLTLARRRGQGIIRIILSGYADAECILKTVGPAHIYLAKPCRPDTLMNAIAQPVALSNFFAGAAAARIALADLETLPSPPEVFDRLEAEIRSPRATAVSVAAILARDVAMTAMILKLTNSAYFGLANAVTTPGQAVRSLGMATIDALTRRIGVFRRSRQTGAGDAAMVAINRTGQRVADLAERIARAESRDRATIGAARCAGMLSGVGQLAWLDRAPEAWLDIARAAGAADGMDASAGEVAAFGADHSLAGAYLLGLWGYPASIVEAVGRSWRPSVVAGGGDNPLVPIVHAARVLAVPDDGIPSPPLDLSYLQGIGLESRVASWLQLAAEARPEVHYAV